jgi:hypothetical protein
MIETAILIVAMFQAQERAPLKSELWWDGEGVRVSSSAQWSQPREAWHYKYTLANFGTKKTFRVEWRLPTPFLLELKPGESVKADLFSAEPPIEHLVPLRLYEGPNRLRMGGLGSGWYPRQK